MSPGTNAVRHNGDFSDSRECLEISRASQVIPDDLRLSIDGENEMGEVDGRQSSFLLIPCCSNREPPSNKTLLCTAFVSFTTFATVQLFFAFLADSEAMKGDSAAMMVDSMTYLFNWYAEVRKDRFDQEFMVNPMLDGSDPEDVERFRRRERRKLVLKLEIIPPLLSVTTLIGVTVVVLKQAIDVLMEKGGVQEHPSLKLMMAFSSFNLGLDFINVFCFARAKHLMGYKTKEDNDDFDRGPGLDDAIQHRIHDDSEEANLNMCSAYTHVFADTLRSLAVIVAALVATTTPGVTPEEADAVAAIVVSVLILMSLIPLFQGLYSSGMELRAIREEERLGNYVFTDYGENGGLSQLPQPTGNRIT